MDAANDGPKEVLSPTTRQFDRFEKVEEYKTVPTLEYIVLVDPDCPQVRLFSRLPGAGQAPASPAWYSI